MKITYIYALKDPITKEIRYIGRSKYPKQRLYEHHHIKRLMGPTHRNRWILSLLNQGLRAELSILEECNEKNWSEREKYWIANTPNLTNTLLGGEGEFERHKPHPYTEETKQKIAQTVSSLHKDGTYINAYNIFSKNYQGKKKKNSPSFYCGVFKVPSGKWLSQIRYHSKTIYLGVHKEEKDAALAYDKKAKELFGIGAKLNFP